MPVDRDFEWSPRRQVPASVATGVVASAVGWFAGSLVFSALAGRPGLPAAADGIVFVVVYTLGFTLLSLRFARRRPPALRLGGEGIELAAERRDAVLIPYGIVAAARVRWFWPITTLEVVVGTGDEPRVRLLRRGGRPPWRRSRGERVRYAMPIAGLRAPAADIRASLPTGSR